MKSSKIPSDFKVRLKGNGVLLYTRTNRNGGKDLLQEVDLSSGAALVLLTEPPTNKPQNPADPEFQRNDFSNIWTRFKKTYPRAFSLSSGAFFGWYTDHSARIAFPLKINHKIKSSGFANHESYAKWMLVLNKNSAAILPYKNTVNNYDKVKKALPYAPNIIVGLDPLCNKDNHAYKQRNKMYIGVKDANKDGIHETVLIYHGSKVTEKDCLHLLQSCGASRTMMLCGGNMTQLICKDKSYKTSTERLPQTIGVVEAVSYASN